MKRGKKKRSAQYSQKMVFAKTNKMVKTLTNLSKKKGKTQIFKKVKMKKITTEIKETFKL